jgi:sulfofructosephosphate aldolase
MTDHEALRQLARPSGAFAMLALDQRESLRTMLAPYRDRPVEDAALAAFKVDAARALSPHASAVLLDVDHGLAAVRSAGALAATAALIVAADTLTQDPGGPVEDTDVDEAVLADDTIAAIAGAYKLLVIWRPDRGEAARERSVTAFLAGCRRRNRPGIVEGIVRASGDAQPTPGEHTDLVVAAARELGALGPDVYKAEVPTHGRTDDAAITAGAERLSEVVACPWVVLSNGTSPDRFPDATIAACRGGASGFLAGRAIWLSSVAAADPRHDLETVAAPRLGALAARVDAVARPWWEAAR